MRFDDIKEIVSEKYGHKMRNPFDLEPEEEQLIGQYAKEEWGSDFVFVTHYPSKKRPFYAMDDPEDSKYTLSFDLLFQGLEITTGGQRIHDYQKLIEKIEATRYGDRWNGSVSGNLQTWNAATWWTWNRTGTSDDEAHGGRQCPRDDAISKRFKQTGTIKK